ncbi:Hypothetical protein NTJ_03516 [Nesidiocoris tenuis]|uniref:Transposase n=1 Tax=Nesidiocoris tenuis TaxID=355587 RepID=A0ABN7AHF3_9HEMI|nr:Hypothetical protein NTJ_03516 [Nesidiocoris tenuis]
MDGYWKGCRIPICLSNNRRLTYRGDNDIRPALMNMLMGVAAKWSSDQGNRQGQFPERCIRIANHPQDRPRDGPSTILVRYLNV